MKNNILGIIKKYFLYTIVILSCFISVKVFAQDIADGADFMISLKDIDPIHGNSGGGAGHSGIKSLQNILETIGNVLLMLSPLLAGVGGVIAGYFYIFSYADSDNVTKAKNIVKFNIIAMTVAFMSGAIIRIIASFL